MIDLVLHLAIFSRPLDLAALLNATACTFLCALVLVPLFRESGRGGGGPTIYTRRR